MGATKAPIYYYKAVPKETYNKIVPKVIDKRRDK